MPMAQPYSAKPYVAPTSASIENSAYHQHQIQQQQALFERTQHQEQQPVHMQLHLNSQMYHHSPQYFQNNYYYHNHLQNQYQMQLQQQQNQRYLSQIVDTATEGVNKLNANIMPTSTSTFNNTFLNDTLTNYPSTSSVSVSTTSALTITSSSGLASSSSSTSSHQGSNNSFEQVC